MAFRVTFKWNGAEASRRISLGVAKGLDRAGDLIIAEALRLILQTPKTGRIYGSHQASAPGESPASETGRLIGGFIKRRRGAQRLTVTNTTDHARKLELGTKKMAPRPFMLRATNNVAKKVEQALAEEVTKALGPSPRRRSR